MKTAKPEVARGGSVKTVDDLRVLQASFTQGKIETVYPGWLLDVSVTGDIKQFDVTGRDGPTMPPRVVGKGVFVKHDFSARFQLPSTMKVADAQGKTEATITFEPAQVAANAVVFTRRDEASDPNVYVLDCNKIPRERGDSIFIPSASSLDEIIQSRVVLKKDDLAFLSLSKVYQGRRNKIEAMCKALRRRIEKNHVNYLLLLYDFAFKNLYTYELAHEASRGALVRRG